jgi:ABC-2 type transport system permease protein
MRPVLVIAAKDLRQRLRDRSALVIGLAAPLAVALLMSLAFKGTENFHYTLALVNADRGPVASAIVQTFDSKSLQPIVKIQNYADQATAAQAVRSGRAQAGLVIPTGYSAQLAGTTPLALTTLTNVNNTTATSVTESIVSSLVAQLDADRLSVATAQSAGSTKSTAELAALASQLRIPEQLVARPVGARQLKVISYMAPAMAIFFAFFLISYTARGFFEDKDQGMIERMRAAPVRPYQILAGKSLSVLVFGLGSLLVILLVTTTLFGAYWGDPLSVVLICAALVLAIVAMTALVIGLARTKRQAEGMSSALVFGLALLGGNFVFLSASPTVMQRIALFTPNGWALRAFTKLSTTGGAMHTATVPVLAILGFALVVGVLAAIVAPRSVTS